MQKQMTEKDVKAEVKNIFKREAPDAHVFMPVQSGYGSPDLDFIVTVNGFSLRIETKVSPKKPTDRQKKTTDDLRKAGAIVLWIDETNLDDVGKVVRMLLRGQYEWAFVAAAASRREFLRD